MTANFSRSIAILKSNARAGLAFVAALLGVFVAAVPACAQIQSGAGSVSLAATLPSSLTVTATPAQVNFALVPNGVSTGTPAVSISTRWSLATIISQVSLYAYFSNPSAALADAGGHNIPAANVSASINGAGYAAFTGSSPFSGSSSVTVFRQYVLGFNFTQQRTDTMNLQISTVGLTLPAATYTGLLTIQAQAL